MPNFNIPQAIEQAQAQGSDIERVQGKGLASQGDLSSGLQGGVQEETEAPQVDTKAPDKPGFGDYVADAALAVPRGVEAFAESTWGLLDWMTGDRLWDWDRKESSLFGRSKTIPGMLGEGIMQFATGFIPGIGIAGKLGKLTKLGKIADKSGDLLAGGVIQRAYKGKKTLKLSTMRKLKKAKRGARKAAQYTAAGAMSDFVAFKGEQARLSNLLIGHKGEDSSAILEYLAYDPAKNNNEVEERFKNVIEGFFVGSALGGLFVGGKTGYRGLKSARKAHGEKFQKLARTGPRSRQTSPPDTRHLDEMEGEWQSRQPAARKERRQRAEMEATVARVDALKGTHKAAAAGLAKTFKVFRDTGKNLENQKARGEKPDEVAAYAEAAEANKLTPDEKKSLRTVESAAKDAQTAKAYEATTKRKISEERHPLDDLLESNQQRLDALGGKGIRDVEGKGGFDEVGYLAREKASAAAAREEPVVPKEEPVVKTEDELLEKVDVEGAAIRRVDGNPFQTERGLKTSIKRQGKKVEDFDIVTTKDGGFEGVPKVPEKAPVAKVPEYSPIDASKASADELDGWVRKNLGTSWRAVDIESKRSYVENVQKSSGSEEYVLRQAAEAAEQKIRDAGMFEGGPQAAYSAVRLVKSMPELRVMVDVVARMGAEKAARNVGAGKALSKEAVEKLEKETEELVGMGIEVAGGNKAKPLDDLSHFRGRVEDLKTVRNEAETLYGFFMEASGDVRNKVINAVEARDNGSVMITGADGAVKSMGPEEALTDLFSSLDRFLAVQETWADFGTQLSLGLRQRQDFYKTGSSALGRDIANQNRRLGFDSLNKEGGTAGKMAQRLFRKGVRSSMKESKFLRKMEMQTKHDGATTPKSIEDAVQKSENHAMAMRLSAFVPSGKKLMAVTQEWYINALLGSPTTWSVNLLGNGLVMALRHFELSAGALLTGNIPLLKAHTRALFDVHSFMDSLKYMVKAGWDDEAKSIAGHTAYSDNKIRAKGEIFSERGAEPLKVGGPEGNTFYKAINWLGKGVRHPTRILMAGDEFFKQMNFRAHAKTMLAVEGYQKGLHKTPKALAKFVDDGFKGLVTDSGRFRNEANVLKDAYADLARRKEAGELFAPGKAEEAHIAKYMDDHFNSHELTLKGGEIYNAKDLGQRNQLVEGATDWALINTFTNEPTNPLVKMLNSAATFSPWLTFVVPFVRTPSNIITFALGRVLPTTPMRKLGRTAFDKARGKDVKGTEAADLLKAQEDVKRGFLKNKKYSVDMPNADAMIAEKIELLSRAGSFEAADYTGRLAFSGLAVSSVFLLVEGIKDKITGAAPTSKTKRAAWEMDGKQPYSMKLDFGGGERWYSYLRMDPFATVLGIHADIVHGMIDSREDDGGAFGNEEEVEEKRPWINRSIGVLAMSFANNVSNKSYVENLGSMLDLLLKPTQTGTQVAGQVIGGFVPNGLNVSQNVFEEDPAILESRLLLDKLMKKIPEGLRPEVKEDKWYVSKKLMPRRNYLGEVMRKQHTGGLIEGLNPIFSHDVSNDIVDMEISSHGTGKGTMTPMLSAGGEKVNMHEYRNEEGQTAYDRVQELSSQVEIRGMKLRQAMRFIIESDNYQRLMDVTDENQGPHHPRTKALSTLVNRYRASAKNQLFKEFPELKQDYRDLLNR